MKSVKKVVLSMVLVAMAALTACGGEKSAENQADCKVAYAENGKAYTLIDRDATWGKNVFKKNDMEKFLKHVATDKDVGERETQCDDKQDPEYSYVIYNVKGHENAQIKLLHHTKFKMEEKYLYVISDDDYSQYDEGKKATEKGMPALKK